MYQLIVESFLGLKRQGDKLRMAPCIPKEWDGFKIHYRFNSAVYHIAVTQKDGEQAMQVTIDGVVQEDKMIPLTDDGAEHDVEVMLFTNTNA
jgi:cellobiose phosphorylase